MKNIILIGFMGTGKTTTGRLLAKRLKRPFIDIDQKIEKNLGITIPEIFLDFGESFFREHEKLVVTKVSKYTNTIIATGGGVVVDQENFARLRTNGVIIALTASVDVIHKRTERRNNRPLIAGENIKERICTLLESRSKYYNLADLTIDTSYLSPYAVVDGIVEFLRQGGHLRGKSYF